MDAGETFSIGFRTCNVLKNTGGEWVALEECKKFLRKTVAEMTAEHKPHELKLKRDPRHFENSTRNILIISSGQIIKVHLRLIRMFNSKPVI